MEILNVNTVDRLRRERGVSKKDLAERLGLSQSFGYLMLKTGMLPDDLPRRRAVLDKLAKYLGVGVPEITLRLEARERLPA